MGRLSVSVGRPARGQRANSEAGRSMERGLHQSLTDGTDTFQVFNLTLLTFALAMDDPDLQPGIRRSGRAIVKLFHVQDHLPEVFLVPKHVLRQEVGVLKPPVTCPQAKKIMQVLDFDVRVPLKKVGAAGHNLVLTFRCESALMLAFHAKDQCRQSGPGRVHGLGLSVGPNIPAPNNRRKGMRASWLGP